MQDQSGYSFISILMLGIILLGGLAWATFGSGPSVSGQVALQKSAQLVAQSQLIVHRIVKCATDYPSGDNGAAFHKAYPIDGNPAPVATTSLVCPGNNQNLWSGVDGVYAPAPITGFGSWTYNHAQPITIAITATQPGSQSAAIASAAAKIGVAATATADTLTVKIIE